MKSCRDITKIAASGSKLSLFNRMSVLFHMMLCSACRRFKAQSAEIDEAIKASSTNEPLDEAARARIRKQICDD